MFMPKIIVQPVPMDFNVNLICRNLSTDKAVNKTRPFAEKTYLMFPELRGVIERKSEEERKEIIKQSVEKRLTDASEEISERVQYFQQKFDTFLYGFLEAQCMLYNYSWKEAHPRINCYVGYMPFYPRHDIDKWFCVSYNDEERVFSGAVHEINHMIFYEKWKEINSFVCMPAPKFPEPIWFLQEMIVDPTLNDPSVKVHTLYKNRAYDLFYQPLSDGKSMMDRLNELYQRKTSIEVFMRGAFAFVEKNINVLISDDLS